MSHLGNDRYYEDKKEREDDMNSLQKTTKQVMNDFDCQCSFIQQSFKSGLCTYEEAMKALDTVADTYKKNIKEAFDYCLLGG